MRHNRAIASGDRWWENTSPEKTPAFSARNGGLVFNIGKFKGKQLSSIRDRQYLTWFLDNVDTIHETHKGALKQHIQSLSGTLETRK